MKNNQTALVLVGLMFMLSFGTVLLLLRYNASAKELKDITLRIQIAKNTESFIAQLRFQVEDYSKTHPDVSPILHSFTNGMAGLAAPVKPAAK
jgi:hypothetical protein